MHAKHFLTIVRLSLVLGVTGYSCTKKIIDFGEQPGNNYTKLVYIDTVAVKLSTVILDSFQTSGATSFLLGRYRDPYLGVVSARPFFQLKPVSESIDIPSTAIFDSLVLIIRPNDYYYGDTAKPQTVVVHELAQTIGYTYNNKLYNTSSIATRNNPLGSRTLRMSPVNDDSIIIRLDQAKGIELFEKLRQRSTDVTNEEAFRNYFKGISLSFPTSDTTAVYGLSGNTSTVMRVLYHHTTPVIDRRCADFTFDANTYAFNQVLYNRTGSGLPATTTGVKEIPSTQTGNVAFAQNGTGLLLKMIFPSLRDILKNDDIVQLLKAEVIVRPTYQSFDDYRQKLPSALHLATTDGTNIVGDEVLDSVGVSQVVSPFIDRVYGENTHYRFDVTSYIKQMLETPGSEDFGFFLLEDWSTTAMQVNRAVINDANRPTLKTQLRLSIFVVNK